MKKYFGTDGARGIANKELTNEFAYKTGRAIVKYINKDKVRVLVGMDTRISSKMLQMSLMSGIIAEGGEAVDLGVIPTPGVAYLAVKNSADIAVMISASHNPYEYNGIKLIGGDGYKLSDKTEIEIETIIDNIESDEKAYDEIGEYVDGRCFDEDYKKHILSIPKNSFKGLKIGLDSGDGVMSYYAEELLTALGASVTSIYSEGNGRYINDESGSTCPEKIAQIVKDNNLDIGVAFDGDADRVIFADENGKVIDGDHIISYAALNYKKNGKLSGDGVVTTTMSNGAFEKHLIKNDIHLERADVGDRYVMQEMRKNQYLVGGEKSGHIIFLDKSTMGDGIQTAVTIIDMLIENEDKASKIGDAFTDYPQVLVNAKADNELKKNYKNNSTISAAIDELLTKHSDFRILIRPSGTEPFVRIMIEGNDIEAIKNEAENLKNIIEGVNND